MRYKPLNPPPMVRDQDAQEIMRAAVLGQELHFSLMRGFADPAAWGLVFVDAARHVARVTGKDVPMPYAANLEKLALPSVAEVVEAAKAVCYR